MGTAARPAVDRVETWDGDEAGMVAISSVSRVNAKSVELVFTVTWWTCAELLSASISLSKAFIEAVARDPWRLLRNYDLLPWRSAL